MNCVECRFYEKESDREYCRSTGRKVFFGKPDHLQCDAFAPIPNCYRCSFAEIKGDTTICSISGAKVFDPSEICADFSRGKPTELAPETEKLLEENKHPDRYVGKYECWEVIKDRLDNSNLTPFQGFLYGCAFKYLWRLGHKDSLEQELIKARNYIDRFIQDLSSEEIC